MSLLDGKAVVVTGAAQGLGRAYALAAAAEGASVLVTDVSTDVESVAVEIVASGGRAQFVVGSVADVDDAERAIATCAAEFGSVDGLVNNAGLYLEGRFWEQDLDRMALVVDVNVRGAINIGSLAARRMHAQGHGAIVNVTSGAAIGYPMVSTYSGTKGAMLSLTYSWALDALGTGIRVNAIAPIARTAMTTATEHQRATAGDSLDPVAIAPLAVYLLSDRSAPITGQAIRFDGRTLQPLSGPTVGTSQLSQEHWDTASVGAALEGPLREALRPFGIARVSPSGDAPTAN